MPLATSPERPGKEAVNIKLWPYTCPQWLCNNDILSLRTPVPRLCSECTTAVWRTKRVGLCFQEAQMSSRGLHTRGLPMITATLGRRAWNNIHPLIMALFIWRMFTGECELWGCIGVGGEGTSQCASVSSTSAELFHFFPSFPHSLPLSFHVLFPFFHSNFLPPLPPSRHLLSSPKRAQVIRKLANILQHQPSDPVTPSHSSLDLLPPSLAATIRRSGSLGRLHRTEPETVAS